MIQFITLTLIAFLVQMVISRVYNAQIVIAPVMGFLLGTLYHKEDFGDEIEHTLQVSLMWIVITITFTRDVK